MTIIIEPEEGISPIIDAIRKTRRFIFLNFYMIDEKQIIDELKDLKKKGRDVRVIYDGKPYGEKNFSGNSAVIQDSGLNVKKAPPRFDESNVFDHAKYFVSDRMALIGTANMSDASFSKNREYIYITKEARIRKVLKNIFLNDWNGGKNDSFAIPRDLILSPGSEKRIVEMIARAKFIETEEMGDDPAVMEALRKRKRIRMILPSTVTQQDRARLEQLAKSGLRIRLMPSDKLYMHAKMIISDRVFIGSQNFSATSLNRNREVGIILGGFFQRRRLIKAFKKDWKAAQKF